ncbi:MAG: shikimate kinase [Clostridia bacterium]
MKIKHNIALIGLSGCYKTTVGKILAKQLSMLNFDTDEYIEFEYSKTIKAFFEEYGEKAFREVESNAIEKTLDFTNVVISTGAGVALNKTNMDNLAKDCYIVHLTASADTILNRIESENFRPLLLSPTVESISCMASVRLPLYRKYADFTVNTNRRSSEKVAELIIAKLTTIAKEL